MKMQKTNYFRIFKSDDEFHDEYTVYNSKSIVFGFIIFRDDFEENKRWVFYPVKNMFFMDFALKEIADFMEMLNKKEQPKV
jgi:hypothetical protein